MVSKEAKFVIIFLIFLFSTQWFLILFQNHTLLELKRDNLIFFHKQVFIDETNTLRGDSLNNNKTLIGRLFVNKFTIYGQEMTTRYLEAYDPNYLFFTGGVDRITSTGNSGQIPLVFLPLIIFGLYKILTIKSRRKYLLIALIILSPILSVLFYRHYEWIPKILFFFSLTLVATNGVLSIPRSKKYLLAIIVAVWLFETVGLYHKFKNHYIEELSTQIYNIKKK